MKFKQKYNKLIVNQNNNENYSYEINCKRGNKRKNEEIKELWVINNYNLFSKDKRSLLKWM